MRVGVIGASGAVGRELVDVLGRRAFPMTSLRLFASARSAGTKVKTPLGEAEIETFSDAAMRDLDLALLAVSGDFAKAHAPAMVAAWLLTFTLSFDDVVISEFLSGPGVTTLPQVIFSYARRGINPSIYAAATLLIAVVSLAVIAYSVYEARQHRQRLRDMRAASLH